MKEFKFKALCDAAVTMGEMDEGTARYFHDLYLQSDEHRLLNELELGVRIVLPQNMGHAQAMMLVASNFIKAAGQGS